MDTGWYVPHLLFSYLLSFLAVASLKGGASNIGALKCSGYRQYGKSVGDRGFSDFSRHKNSVETLLTGPTQLP